MRLLGIDFETTWTQPVNAKQCRITEIGAILMEWDTKSPLAIQSDMIFEEDHQESPQELVDLTGITDEMRKEFGRPLKEGLANLFDLIAKADYLVAHNGNEFDKIVFEEECYRLNVNFPESKWIDTKTDIPFPKTIKTTKLTYLCAEHGFVNPFAHRAVFDVQSMLKVLSLYPIAEVIKLSHEETVRVIASVSYEKKDDAKNRGYYWDGEKKYWHKTMKASKANIEQNEAPFSVQIRSII